jgi:hypothetical protein
MTIMYRAWINQPSTLQTHHKLHGKYCIVIDNREQYLRVFFTEGPVHSMLMDRLCLSKCKLSSAED